MPQTEENAPEAAEDTCGSESIQGSKQSTTGEEGPGFHRIGRLVKTPLRHFNNRRNEYPVDGKEAFAVSLQNLEYKLPKNCFSPIEKCSRLLS